MSILSELKKLTGKQNANVVSEALPPVLPVPEEGDSGKAVMVAKDGKYKLDDFPAELPSVSASDNGKMLGVENGEWAKVDAPSGGSDPFLVAVDLTNGTLDKTFAEVKQAYSNGQRIFFYNNYLNTPFYQEAQYFSGYYEEFTASVNMPIPESNSSTVLTGIKRVDIHLQKNQTSYKVKVTDYLISGTT